MSKAFICGCEGTILSSAERTFFARQDPWGLILFARNCETPEQVKSMVADFRDVVGRADAPVLIDQEGGRVQRLGPPHWPRYPSGAQLSAAFAEDPEAGKRKARNLARLIAEDLISLGINVDCLPVLDVPQPGAHEIISDRAYGATPSSISELGWIMCQGLMEGGVLPVIKHLPGHGRAAVDSHLALPVVSASREELSEVDFAPFKALNEMPLGMTAHIIYEAFDGNQPATFSPVVIKDVIRTEIGFDGLLMTDDLSMHALDGSFSERARRSIEAGCDVVLHCNGDMQEMQQVADSVPELAGQAAVRAERALKRITPASNYDRDLAQADLASFAA